MSEPESIAHVQEAITGLVRTVPGVRGVLLATRDGHPVTHHLPADSDQAKARPTAAMIAALLGIGNQLSELTGDPELLEATVRSPAGSVVIYAVGSRAVMTVLTDETVNLARLNHEARRRVDGLAELIEAMPRASVPYEAAS